MSVINTNVNSLVAQRSMVGNAKDLATAMERLSTGKRINSASDDAAGLAISTRMTSQTRGLSMAVRNANDGISLMQTSEGALNEVTDILQRMRELAVQSTSDTNTSADRSALNDEVTQLKAEIDRIATTTMFNNQALLDGTFTDKKLQIGDQAGQTMDVSIQSVKIADLGMGGVSSGSNTLIGARWDDSPAAAAAGDIKINGQELGAIATTDDLEDIIKNINENVDNVTASAFNTITAKTIGDGVTTDGEFKLQVTSLGASAASTFSISASETLQELVDNINTETGGLVAASINDDGKLVLSNTTGATIGIADGSGTASQYDTASGFKEGATAAAYTSYSGFIKLESTNGSPVSIERGDEGTMATLTTLGFNEVTDNVAAGNDAYTVLGDGLTTAGVTGAWGATDIKINGVAIYDEDIATTTFSGKLEAINNFSSETGVIASAYFKQSFTIEEESIIAGAISLNGVALTALTTANDLSTFVTNINAKTAQTGITATRQGDELWLEGANVQSVTFTGTAGGIGDLTTAAIEYASIKLDSVNETPISIELGDDNTLVEHGFNEANVGAADFQVNAATLGVGSGTSMTGLSVETSALATAALATIDNALTSVSTIRSSMGAVQNRLDHTVNNLTNVISNTEAARSRIEDTDYAVETTQLAKAQIIAQAANAMLAQANQQPQSVLSLLQ
ncbi:MAG: flagellin [Burkholderiales bacterium]|nr:flagellin [Burkholderiales bacterium]